MSRLAIVIIAAMQVIAYTADRWARVRPALSDARLRHGYTKPYYLGDVLPTFFAC
jgi:hypothetical protein